MICRAELSASFMFVGTSILKSLKGIGSIAIDVLVRAFFCARWEARGKFLRCLVGLDGLKGELDCSLLLSSALPNVVEIVTNACVPD